MDLAEESSGDLSAGQRAVDEFARELADELHDGTVQWIVGAKMQAEALRAALIAGRTMDVAQFDALVQSLRIALVQARQLMRGLHGPDIRDGMWHEELRIDLKQARDALEVEGAVPQLELELQPETEPLGIDLAKNVYRLVREAVWNALRHSKGATVHARVQRRGDVVQIDIRDDGVGFALAEIPQTRHGVRGLIARTERIGGMAELMPCSQGSHWRFELPHTPIR